MKQWFNKIKKYNWAFIIVWSTMLVISYLLWSEIFKLIKKVYE